jgi:hypothetical protein
MRRYVYRYAASMGEPPRGAYMPTNTTRPQQQHGGTNPWDHDEKEKVRKVLFLLFQQHFRHEENFVPCTVVQPLTPVCLCSVHMCVVLLHSCVVLP